MPQYSHTEVPAPPRRSSGRRGGVLIVWGMLALVAFVGFVALGNWQMRRMVWKHDLIARVAERIHAPAVAAPGPGRWSSVSAERDEYRRVSLSGTFVNQKETLVQANTDLGPGYWVLTPLRQDDGSYVLVNRGFVSPAQADPAKRGGPVPEGQVKLTGLLRISEPGGGFLRHNDPAQGRWYSRDVQAIAAAKGLAPVAPFFVDQSAAAGDQPVTAMSAPPSSWPVPGLTVVAFRDTHLVYAITWYTLALMVAAGAWYVGRIEYRRGRLNTRHAYKQAPH